MLHMILLMSYEEKIIVVRRSLVPNIITFFYRLTIIIGFYLDVGTCSVICNMTSTHDSPFHMFHFTPLRLTVGFRLQLNRPPKTRYAKKMICCSGDVFVPYITSY